jgi:LmbE family N-acetylglucosaminyl deacetylase
MTQPNNGLFFHPALRACMSEGRLPRPRELEQVAARIWRDAYRSETGLEWPQVAIGSFYERRTLAAARAAAAPTRSGRRSPKPPEYIARKRGLRRHR